MRIAILESGRRLNAIDQASACLAGALSCLGHETTLVGRAGLRQRRDDVVVIPYNPFMWGRWGFAPGLVADVSRLRLRRRGPRVVLLVHEPYVPILDARSLLMGSWQRIQLLFLLLLADKRFASIETWAVSYSAGSGATTHLPSGSNVPDARARRAEARADLGIENAVAVATLSTGHPSHLAAFVEEALERMAAVSGDVVHLRLGAGSLAVRTPVAVRVIAPGELSADGLARRSGAADVLLTPFVDGVSTRRGKLHGGTLRRCLRAWHVGCTDRPVSPFMRFSNSSQSATRFNFAASGRALSRHGRRGASRRRTAREGIVRGAVRLAGDRTTISRCAHVRAVRVLIVAPWGERAGSRADALDHPAASGPLSGRARGRFLSRGPLIDEVASLGIDAWVVQSGPTAESCRVRSNGGRAGTAYPSLATRCARRLVREDPPLSRDRSPAVRQCFAPRSGGNMPFRPVTGMTGRPR